MTILFVSLSNIGDAILTLPTFDELRKQFPDATFDVIAGEHSRVVFQGMAGIRDIYVFHKKAPFRDKWRFWRFLHAQRYDYVVDLRRSLLSLVGRHKNWFALLWPAPRRLHKASVHLDYLARMGFYQEEAPLPNEGLIPKKNYKAEGRTLYSEGARTVVMAPGSKSHIKQWPLEFYAALADLIADDGFEIQWIGSQDEQGLIASIRSRMKNRSLDYSGRLSWPETVKLMGGAEAVITNDSAPLHAAQRLGKKTLVFFGPTDPVKYGPTHSPEGLLYRHRFCSPCEKAQCRYELQCLKEISVDEAYGRFCRLMASGEKLSGKPRLLLVRLDRMGDVLVSLSAARVLKEKYPEAHVSMLVRPYVAALVRRSLLVDEVIEYRYEKKGEHRFPFGYLRFINEIRKRRFDECYVLHPNVRSHLVAFLSGIPRRFGYRRALGAFILTRALVDSRDSGLKHESKNVLEIIRLGGAEGGPASESLSVQAEDRRLAEKLLAQTGAPRLSDCWVFHAGSRSPSKQWPKESFVHLGRLVHKAQLGSVLLIGTEEDRPTNRFIQSQLGELSHDLTGLTDYRTLLALLKETRVLIANDSGPAHLASSAGGRVVALFGRSQPGLGPVRWKPLGVQTRALWENAGCEVCLADDCPINFQCLRLLTPEKVFENAKELLSLP